MAFLHYNSKLNRNKIFVTDNYIDNPAGMFKFHKLSQKYQISAQFILVPLGGGLRGVGMQTEELQFCSYVSSRPNSFNVGKVQQSCIDIYVKI